jgi:hypothetical protein
MNRRYDPGTVTVVGDGVERLHEVAPHAVGAGRDAAQELAGRPRDALVHPPSPSPPPAPRRPPRATAEAGAGRTRPRQRLPGDARRRGGAAAVGWTGRRRP